MPNDNFVEILKDLQEKKAESKVKHDRYNENIDLLIKNAQSIIKLNDERECAYPPTTPGRKVKVSGKCRCCKKRQYNHE